MEKDIFVTRPFLPPLEKFIPLISQIWNNKILTNGGPFHKQLENKLEAHLGIKKISLFSNGTIALISALQALRVTGDVITTPYSFVATSNALHWHGNKPIFVDISPDDFNINPSLIEAAITPNTSAILAVHCYGNPCNTEKIKRISETYNLSVIYDACHAFGVEDQNGSILNYGDLSVLSFHATKVFSTFEGGAIVSHDDKMKTRIDRLKNFGFVDETTVVAPGINGKMSELNAAFGTLYLDYMEEIVRRRQELDQTYRRELAKVEGIEIPPINNALKLNFSYFPILVTKKYHESRDQLYERLRSNRIFARRYFYPLISDFPMYSGHPSASPGNLPIAKKVSNEILCLPLYPTLSVENQQKIIEIIVN